MNEPQPPQGSLTPASKESHDEPIIVWDTPPMFGVPALQPVYQTLLDLRRKQFEPTIKKLFQD